METTITWDQTEDSNARTTGEDILSFAYFNFKQIVEPVQVYLAKFADSTRPTLAMLQKIQL